MRLSLKKPRQIYEKRANKKTFQSLYFFNFSVYFQKSNKLGKVRYSDKLVMTGLGPDMLVFAIIKRNGHTIIPFPIPIIG